MLEFGTTVGGTYVNGVDLIRCDDTGRIVESRVMSGPLQAINAVHEQMRSLLASLEPAATSGREVKNMPSVSQQRNIPEVIRSLSSMESPDYIDLFTVMTEGAADATPEQWCRTAIEDVAGLGGQFIWRGVLGLRLKSRPSTERVGGWRIADRGEDWVRLEASSWFLTAHLVTHLDPDHLSVGTFIRYDRPIAALIWVPASAVHRRKMPGLLRQTVRLRAGRSESALGRSHDRASSPEGGH
jgi:hypothetical protein